MAVTAVVSSVAQAYPVLAGNAAVTLLTSPPLFHLDRGRFVSDGSHHDKILNEHFPPLDAEHAIFTHERTQAHERAHRREQLEGLAVRLQLGPHREAVQKLLDDGLPVPLPPAAEQDDEIKLWRLLLHRVDLRNFEVTQTLPDGSRLIQSSAPASDVQAVVETNTGRRWTRDQPAHEPVALGRHNVGREKPMALATRRNTAPPCRSALLQQMAAAEPVGDGFEERLEDSAVPQVAAICIRDHWDELIPEQREWCTDCVCGSITKGPDHRDHIGNMMSGTLDGNRAAADVLPVLLGRTLSDVRRQQVTVTLALALTHAQGPLRTTTAFAVGRQLWDLNPALVWSCVGALVKEARLLKAARKEESGMPFHERKPWEESEQAAVSAVRPGIAALEPVDRDQLLSLPLEAGSGHNLLPLLLGILVLALPTDTVAIGFFGHVATTLARAWAMENEKGRRSMSSKFNDDQEGLD